MYLLYSSLIRSRLEYCSTVWCPFYAEAIDRIEKVQKKFTRLLYFRFDIAHPRPPYRERLKHLKLRSLETRRLINDEIMLYKLVHGHVDSTLCHNLSFHQPSRVTRRDQIFYLPKMTTNYQFNAPIYRVQRNHDLYFHGVDIINSRFFAFKRAVKLWFVW